MADTDTIDVTFNQQKVFHDGTSMVVAKAGETKPVERRLVPGLLADEAIGEPDGWAEEQAERSEMAVADGAVYVAPADAAALAQFDHDGDGKPGGSQALDLPTLTGKNKAELLEIAAAEGATVGEGATNAEIVDAIEAGRAADLGPDAPLT